jgi:hypothetical protein
LPLAYFITFTSYGVWLHGREIGSVDKENNAPGTAFLPPDPIREGRMQANMREAPYLLDDRRRAVVLATIREVALHRGWQLLACHVRTNHVHIVVSAEAKPEKAMSDFKAYASRRLKEQLGETADSKRWTQHGSNSLSVDGNPSRGSCGVYRQRSRRSVGRVRRANAIRA